MKKWGVLTLVIFGAVVITALGIDAADTFSGNGGTLLSRVIGSSPNGCGDGMVPVENHPTLSCVDVYEASPSEGCPYETPGSIFETEKNLNEKTCHPASVEDTLPWRFVSLAQAERLCSRAGKRLPTSDEWYSAALGTPEEQCVIQHSAAEPGGSEGCVSDQGAYDMVGNVWEWVDETVIGNMLKNQSLPTEGYVASVDASGIAIETSDTEQELYGSDYFWSKEEGVYGMLRGGFYGSKSDAGIYAVNAAAPTTFATPGIGFRCVTGQ